MRNVSCVQTRGKCRTHHLIYKFFHYSGRGVVEYRLWMARRWSLRGGVSTVISWICLCVIKMGLFMCVLQWRKGPESMSMPGCSRVEMCVCFCFSFYFELVKEVMQRKRQKRKPKTIKEKWSHSPKPAFHIFISSSYPIQWCRISPLMVSTFLAALHQTQHQAFLDQNRSFQAMMAAQA